MKNYVIYDTTGKILRTGYCSVGDFHIQPLRENEFIIEGIADDIRQKVVGNFGQYGLKPLGFLKIVDKTPEEIIIKTPKKPGCIQCILHEKQLANITNEQWQDVLNRLETLEKNNERRS